MELDALLGPYGLVVGCIIVIAWLARDHQRADAEDRRQRDIALEGWKQQTDANTVSAAAHKVDAEARLAASQRHRSEDPS